MQGTLNEIDIRSILQLIELGQRTGELFVEAYLSQPRFRGDDLSQLPQSSGETVDGSAPAWFVFFVNGRIAYATDRHNSSLSRLQDYLYRHQGEKLKTELQNSHLEGTAAPEYAAIWLLLEKHILTPEQGRNIIESMIQETLFDLLSLRQGSFIFEMGSGLTPQLITLEIAPLVTKIMKQVQQWKQFHPHIQSPFQCFMITDRPQLSKALSANVYKNLDRWADGQTSLRQMSRYLHRDLLTLAKAIYPYIQQGWVQMLNPQSETRLATSQNRATQGDHILCIDDDLTIAKSVEQMLQYQGYQATIISDPLTALSHIFQLQPDLILCDIAMPKLDGYELCAMLRHSSAFRQTPIIMLTGKEGFIDRVRARMVGATDYLTKPFGSNELVMLLEKYLGAKTHSKSNGKMD